MEKRGMTNLYMSLKTNLDSPWMVVKMSVGVGVFVVVMVVVVNMLFAGTKAVPICRTDAFKTPFSEREMNITWIR